MPKSIRRMGVGDSVTVIRGKYAGESGFIELVKGLGEVRVCLPDIDRRVILNEACDLVYTEDFISRMERDLDSLQRD